MKWWITIGVVAVVAITVYLVLNTTVANKLVIKVLFSNKRYAKNIEVKTYVLTQEQMVDLFKYPDREPVQLPAEKFNKIGLQQYFVVRVKNLGNRTAWGTLSCKVPGLHRYTLIKIPCIRKYYCDYVICISDFYISSAKDSIYPDMSYKWSELYTK